MDQLDKAANELRSLIVSNGFSDDLVQDVADEFDVDTTPLLNRFRIRFGRSPAEMAQSERRPVPPAALAEVMERVKRDGFYEVCSAEERALIGLRFFHKGEAFLLSRYQRANGVAVAYNVRTGRRWFFRPPLWRDVILPQIQPKLTRST
jgi:hypothetical protein